MGFKVTQDVIKKSMLCPPGMHEGEMVEVDEPYFKDRKGGGATKIYKATFEDKAGYQVPVWFNDAVLTNFLEFIQAADKVQLINPKTGVISEDFADSDLDPKDYLHKPVCYSVSHRKDDNGKMQAQIDNFYQAGQVPF